MVFIRFPSILYVTDVCIFQLIAERDRLNKDLEAAHSAIKQLEAELDNLQVSYNRGSGRR